MAATTAPPVVVLRSEPLPMDEMANEVVVACVVVALIPVKFWRVDEPVAKRFWRVARPETPSVELRVTAPLAWSVPKSAPFVALKRPLIVEEPNTANVFVEVPPEKSRLAKCEVEEAKIPAVKAIGVEVELTLTP